MTRLEVLSEFIQLVRLKPPYMTSPQTFQCTAFSVYRGSVIEEQRHMTVGCEQRDPPVQILLCGGRSGLAWGIKPRIL